MPRGRGTSYADEGPTDADLAEFAQLLGGRLDDATSFPLAGGVLARLIEACADKGYAVRVAPIDGGHGRAFVLYLGGERKVERRGSDAEKFEEDLKLLFLAVEKLPRKRG